MDLWRDILRLSDSSGNAVELAFVDPSLTEGERLRLGLRIPDQVVGAGPEISDEESF